jgi:nitrite reductase (NADH) small subunit
MSTATVAIKLSKLMENGGVCALINDVQVAIFYLPQENPCVYAISNHDPVAKANVISRGIVGDINGELAVASPMYKQHFSLSSGICLEDQSIQLPVYHARVDGDAAVISLQAPE